MYCPTRGPQTHCKQYFAPSPPSCSIQPSNILEARNAEGICSVAALLPVRQSPPSSRTCSVAASIGLSVFLCLSLFPHCRAVRTHQTSSPSSSWASVGRPGLASGYVQQVPGDETTISGSSLRSNINNQTCRYGYIDTSDTCPYRTALGSNTGYNVANLARAAHLCPVLQRMRISASTPLAVTWFAPVKRSRKASTRRTPSPHPSDAVRLLRDGCLEEVVPARSGACCSEDEELSLRSVFVILKLKGPEELLLRVTPSLLLSAATPFSLLTSRRTPADSMSAPANMWKASGPRRRDENMKHVVLQPTHGIWNGDVGWKAPLPITLLSLHTRRSVQY
ncbi:conserved hypothetical protein [Coccidioides posadasii str. Silveira]|uniref:Uncharacterized protein n=1 Tax=Coccidioides posadasii (strain RMSCC 757 / Silveira) TaxID=443226 RepID=E9D4E9_COCPS|nr:conserved hypothetical protein [Coccidioides posadasii str. Silveira]